MRNALESGVPVVVKIGSSSIARPEGGLDPDAVRNVVDQVVGVIERGNPAVLVTSGAIAAGFPTMGHTRRPTQIADLQVAAAIGQTRLMERYTNLFAERDIAVGQVLLTRDVLGNRHQYLNARSAIERMLELGIVPIVNENDTVAVDEVRFGDNDRLAAITSHLAHAGMLVILTDTSGLYTSDPNLDADAKLLDAVAHSDAVLDPLVDRGGKGTLGSGGVATKVIAARMAAFSGVPTVIASADESGVVLDAVAGRDVGTWIDAADRPLGSRKLWIAFGLPSTGALRVDAGAVAALVDHGRSLLRVGVAAVTGPFEAGDAVEVVGPDGQVVAKGVTRCGSEDLKDDGDGSSGPVIHRDDLVVLAVHDVDD